jgi:hypothetical protein
MAENDPENLASSAESKENSGKLTPWSTVNLEDLEILSEDDLKGKFEADINGVERLDSASDDVENALKTLSNFSTLCIAIAAHHDAKGRYLNSVISDLNEEIEELRKENSSFKTTKVFETTWIRGLKSKENR